MNRSWITGLALAGVAGTAGAAYAGVAAGDSIAPQTQPAPTTAGQSASTTRTISYQIGAAGTASISVADGSLTVTEATAGAGWALVGATGPAAHVEVQFTDTLQLVTFSADLVGDDVVVSLTNVAADGATTTSAAAPMNVTVITIAHEGSTASQPTTPGPTGPPTTSAASTTAAPAPAAAQPAASTTAAPTTAQPASTSTQPAPAATSAPSGSGDDDGDHEDDHEDHGDDGQEHDDD